MKKNILLAISALIIFILLFLVFYLYLQIQRLKPPSVLPFTYKVEQTSGNNLDKINKNNSSEFVYKDLVKIKSPMPNSKIESPLIVEGLARGSWFFEASFPITVVNWDGLIIGEGIAQAQGDWMTENFVPFKAEIKFTKPDYKDNGSLILKKDNPSGLPQNDDAVEIPIFFK